MFAEKIRIVLIKKKMALTDLSNLLGCTPSNITNKLKRDNFSEKELAEIARVLNIEYKGYFEIPETGERI